MKELNLLTDEDFCGMPVWDAQKTDYGAVLEFKTKLFHKAYERFVHTPDKLLLEEFEDFCLLQKFWLDDYALFMALKDLFGGIPWNKWPEDIRLRRDTEIDRYRSELHSEIEFQQYMQYLFFRQWNDLKTYAGKKGIKC